MPTPTHQKKSYMSPQEFRALRESTGLNVTAWAILLDCGPQSIRNIESGGKPIGKQLALCAILLAHPTVRALLPEIFRWKEELLKKRQNTP